jgi:hypothetical protein
MNIQNVLFSTIRTLLSSGKITLEDLTSHYNNSYAAFNGNAVKGGNLDKLVACFSGAENIAVLAVDKPDIDTVFSAIVSSCNLERMGFFQRRITENEEAIVDNYFLPLYENVYKIPDDVDKKRYGEQQPVFAALDIRFILDRVEGWIGIEFGTSYHFPNADGMCDDMPYVLDLDIFRDIEKIDAISVIKNALLRDSLTVPFNDSGQWGRTLTCDLLKPWTRCILLPFELEGLCKLVDRRNKKEEKMSWIDGLQLIQAEIVRTCPALSLYKFERRLNLGVDNAPLFDFILKIKV